ncbi:HlyD family efflux transporter periplasmic adaptor subunit [Paracoccus sp. M683]|uniref:efflux RND transporter periplasmic adaptor subunit n=1 Tax=Paracoccus sp. M683 TaxID=2594268 RepID=UPI00118071B3|nr:HlyD family efflux transporter periplasmic adaptor subunit [Paracoccus sp. M683]TRW99320.1 HlyD family efflux transporter periplasmic adaptor subunit [Paracoccus sp. M683]
MRFLLRSLGGLFITAVTIGLLFLAAFQIWAALEQARTGGPGGRPMQEQAFTVQLVTLTPATVHPVMQVFGTVESRRRLELRAGASGRITFLSPDLHEGGLVAAGQRLVQTDPSAAQAALDTGLAAQAEAQAALEDARRDVLIATDDLAAARIQAELRRAAFDRQRSLADRGLGTSTDRETAELAASGAEQAVLSRQSALANAQSAVSTAELAVRRNQIDLTEARRTLDLTEVRASFAGRVTDVAVVEGGLVSQNEQLAQILDPDALEVQIPLSLQQYSRLVVGDAVLVGTPVRIVLDGSAGRIAVDAHLDRAAASVAEGAAGRTVFARLDQPDPRLRPGDFVTVEIDEPPLANAAVIPAAAVGADGAVLVVGADDRLGAYPVSVLRRQGDDVVIAVSAELVGARIVAERAPQLGTGILVRDAAAPQPDQGASQQALRQGAQADG